MSRDDSRELTRKSTLGIFVLHLAGLLRLRDERLTWCVRGSVPRLGTSRGAGQHERELGAVRGALGVSLGDGTSGEVSKDGGEVRLLTESVSELDRKIV